MVLRNQIGHRAQRTGYWAESKWTNCNEFNPYDHSAEFAYFEKYYDEIKSANSFIIKSEETHDKFFMPVTADELKATLKTLPQEFTDGLKGIFLLAGSNKQLKVSSGKLACFGMYYYNCVFLFPYPKNQFKVSSKKLPAPHIQREYERAGATYTQKNNRWIRTFSEASLKQFYLRDVFIHEIGHHIDRNSNRSYEKAERFAEWFATQYGFKLTN